MGTYNSMVEEGNHNNRVVMTMVEAETYNSMVVEMMEKAVVASYSNGKTEEVIYSHK